MVLIRKILGLSGAVALALVLNGCQTTGASDVLNSPKTTTTVVPAPTKIPLSPKAQAMVKQYQLYDPPRGDVRFVVLSDLNASYGSTKYPPEVAKGIDLIPFWQPDMILCGGDMVAAQSQKLSPETIRTMWTGFDAVIARPLREMNLPFGFTMGNHDASGAQGSKGSFLFQKERTLAQEYWNDPAHDPGLAFVDKFEFPFYYTFEFRDIFFLVWDGSTSKIPAEKLAWAEKELASPRAQKAKMRVLLGHLPLYAVAIGRNKPGEVMEQADQLRTMLERHNVHTYISGHHHAYYPAHRGAMQLLHLGILGSGPRPLLGTRNAPRKTITVLDINFNTPELTTYTTYDMKTLQTIDNEELPRFLVGHNGILLRRDIEYSALTDSEKLVCEQRLGKNRCTD